MLKAFPFLPALLIVVLPAFGAEKATKAGPALPAPKLTRVFNLRVESDRWPSDIVCFPKDSDKGASVPFKIAEAGTAGKGRVDVPLTARTCTINYRGVISRPIDIPQNNRPYTFAVKIEEAALGTAPKIVGADIPPYDITVVLVDDKP